MTELTHFFHTLCLFLFPLFPPTTQRPLFHLVWIFSIDCLQVINLAFHSVVLFRYCIFSSKNPLSVDMNTLREGNGTPLQYSCLENPRDRGACWAAVYGVTGSRTRLTRLSSSSSSMNTLVKLNIFNAFVHILIYFNQHLYSCFNAFVLLSPMCMHRLLV